MSGIRVLDFSNMMAGPYCTRLLADLGAEVIKVEPPEGDHNRSRRPVRNGSAAFLAISTVARKVSFSTLKARRALRLPPGSHNLATSWSKTGARASPTG